MMLTSKREMDCQSKIYTDTNMHSKQVYKMYVFIQKKTLTSLKVFVNTFFCLTLKFIAFLYQKKEKGKTFPKDKLWGRYYLVNNKFMN